jgi:hypothetical protein
MDRDRVKAFSEKVFASMAGAMTAGMAYVGVKTGLFSAMAGAGSMSAAGIVEKTGLQARYVEEWLKGMTTAGYLEHDPATDHYALPEELAYLLASGGTDHFMGGLFLVVPVQLRAAPQVADAFRTGGGVPFEAYGPDLVEAIDLMSAGIYEQRFASHRLGKMPDVVKRLEGGGRVLDVAADQAAWAGRSPGLSRSARSLDWTRTQPRSSEPAPLLAARNGSGS